MVSTVTSIISLSKTVGDTAEPFFLDDVPFFEANFHIQDHAVYYGDGAKQAAVAAAGSVLTFPKGNLREIFFKNRTAGNTATVVAVATVPTAYTREALK